MTDYPPPISPTGNHKIWSMLCHLSGLIGVGFLLPLVVYFAMRRESDYVASNARAALNFHLSILIYCICCIFLLLGLVGESGSMTIGVPLLIIIATTSLILSIVAAVKASGGACYHYPLSIPFVR